MIKRTLKDLTLKDNFLFGAVMMEGDNCRQFLEMVLGTPIDSVKVSKEKSIIYNPEYKGIRLDVFARDEKRTCYNVEMQVLPKPDLAKRNRYYHSQMDMELLLSGRNYSELPNVYTIFICDFDPFGMKKYRYTFRQRCTEADRLVLYDGSCSIFLSTCGTNDRDVPEELLRFLQFVKADLVNSTSDFQDKYVRKLQDSIKYIKRDRKMEEKFMLMEEWLEEERFEARAEGRAEAILEILNEIGDVPKEISEQIMSERNLDVLRKWNRYAARANNLEEFMKNLEK